MKERTLIKHDIAANWAKAKNFIPLAGELIIYDGIVEKGIYIEQPKLKIGDGIHKLAELPFILVESKQTKEETKYEYKDEILELF